MRFQICCRHCHLIFFIWGLSEIRKTLRSKSCLRKMLSKVGGSSTFRLLHHIIILYMYIMYQVIACIFNQFCLFNHASIPCCIWPLISHAAFILILSVPYKPILLFHLLTYSASNLLIHRSNKCRCIQSTDILICLTTIILLFQSLRYQCAQDHGSLIILIFQQHWFLRLRFSQVVVG